MTAPNAPSTWSEIDHLHGWCTESQIGTPIDHSVWSLRDYQEQLCTAEQIGQSKIPPSPEAIGQSPEAEAPSAKTYAQKLQQLSEQAVDAVLNHPGGAAKWFKENPTAHVKLLVKLATPYVPEQNVNMSVEISWLKPGRLAYKDENVVDINGPIQDAKILDALSPPNGAWKPAPENKAFNAEIRAIASATKPLEPKQP